MFGSILAALALMASPFVFHAEAVAPVTHTIVATAGANGSISPSGTTAVNHGTDQTFTVTPDSGYHINTVIIDGESIGLANTYVFANVIIDHTISATFAQGVAPVTHTITVPARANTTSIHPSKIHLDDDDDDDGDDDEDDNGKIEDDDDEDDDINESEDIGHRNGHDDESEDIGHRNGHDDESDHVSLNAQLNINSHVNVESHDRDDEREDD